MELPSVVTAEWLNQNLERPELIILDATLAKPKATNSDIPNHQLQVPGACYFDLDNRFSDKSIDLPHMMCSPEQFQEEANTLGINNDSLIVIYDQHGIYSSPRAWWMLRSMGHEKVAVLDGGLPAWIEAGYPTETKQNQPNLKGDFTAQFENTCFVNADFVKKSIDDKNVIVLDARSRGRFDGVEPEPRVGLRSGHIPNSLSLPFPDVQNGAHMKPIDELKSIFQSMNLHNKRLVFSCGSGLTACIILLAAHTAGYHDLTVYDGSWSEWGQSGELPVATS